MEIIHMKNRTFIKLKGTYSGFLLKVVAKLKEIMITLFKNMTKGIRNSQRLGTS
jgi:hypothetical protein